ncbi:LAFA_0A07470g1_1 [Lachancea sp. 'fantastica']|nr:LAFA_0A07470g1_1 [Lachancea sp. 'fantastica']
MGSENASSEKENRSLVRLDDESSFWRAFCFQTWRVLALGQNKNEWFKLKREVERFRQNGVLRAMEHVESKVLERNIETRYRWLTSMVEGRRFVPMSAEFAGKAPWNEAIVGEEEAELVKNDSAAQVSSTISQNSAINDCSFVASIINIRQRAPASLAIEHPYPSLFNVNLHFNGAPNRLVQVRLSDLTNRPTVCSPNVADKALENAYMQVKNNSSYQYSGSNSALDTFLLNGFIPEVSATHKISVKRIASLFKSASCLITLGTSGTVQDSTLLTNHDYPVTGVSEEGLLTIRDPLDERRAYTVSQDRLTKSFRVVYLNWNAKMLFARHCAFSFKYDASQNKTSPSLIDKPIYQVQNQSEVTEPVWILLERHINLSASDSDFCHLELVSPDLVSPQDVRGSNLGFYLLKLELRPGERKLVGCLSTVSANYSIHFYHVSDRVVAQKYDKNLNLASLDDEWDIVSNSGPFSNACYYMNPTFELVINGTGRTTQYVDMQLVSYAAVAINAQVFHSEDLELARPILTDNTYESKIHIRRSVPLATDTRYHIICSTFQDELKPEKFKLVVLDPSGCNAISLKRVYPQFGPHRYRNKYDFDWRGKNRKKLRVSPRLTTKAQVRVLALQPNAPLSIRINVFTNDSKAAVFTSHEFSKVPRHGLVIKDMVLKAEEPLVMLIEKHGPVTAFQDTKMRLELGSDFDVVMNEV